MSSDNNRLRFHMGCGERLQSRRRIVRCISGILLQSGAKPASCKSKTGTRQRGERDES